MKHGSISSRGGRLRKLGAIVGSLLLLSGCVGVFDPIVVPTDSPSAHPTLADAIEHASNLKQQYLVALQNQARLTTWVGPGVFPLAAASAGLGIFGTHPMAIGVLGLTGVTAIATAAFLRNQPAQLAYLTGFEALTCATRAVVPLQIASAGSEEGQAFQDSLSHIGPEISAVQVQIAVIEGMLPLSRADAQAYARSEIETARHNAAEAERTRSAGLAVRAMAATAPRQLIEATNEIQGTVNRIIVRNLPDTAAIATTMGSLVGGYRQVTAVAPELRSLATPPATDGSKPQSANLSEQLAELARRVQALLNDQAAVAVVVNAVNAQRPSTELERCGMKADEIMEDLSVQPPGPYNFAAGESKKAFTVRGGRAPYDAAVVSGDSGVVVRRLGFSSQFEIERSDAAVGSYVVMIRDASGRTATLTVTVPTKAAPPSVARGPQTNPNPPQTNPNPPPNCAALKPNDDALPCTSAAEFRELRRQLCFPTAKQFPRWDPEAQQALLNYKREVLKLPEPTTVLTLQIKTDLLATTAADYGSRCIGIIGIEELHTVATAVRALTFTVAGATFRTLSKTTVKKDEIDISACLLSGAPQSPSTVADVAQGALDAARKSYEAKVKDKPWPKTVTRDHLHIFDVAGTEAKSLADIRPCR